MQQQDYGCSSVNYVILSSIFCYQEINAAMNSLWILVEM